EIKQIEDLYKKQDKPFNITRIFITHSHPDHFSGLKLLRKRLHVKVVVTKKTAAIIKNKKSFIRNHHSSSEDLMKNNSLIFSRLWGGIHGIFRWFFYKPLVGLTFLENPDEIIDENSEISINGEIWTIFPTPGHASDHVSLYNEKIGVLFAGDNILRRVTTWLGPPDSNLNDYIQTIEQLSRLPNLQVIFSAHGGPITNPKERIQEVLKHRLRRTDQVKSIVQKHGTQGISPDDIIRELYPNIKLMKHELARGWVVLTLRHLEEQNQIRSVSTKKGIDFFSTIQSEET
ncbi:MAG: MBL fold metallo-hydrolase, partial [Candidatus Aminicenantes bacterium]|nr:MBL fold metallo-hydrolase [Candidatus Aminicenantes bacterium]